MGEGGCVLTDDELLARIARSIRDWGRDCYCAGGENNTCGKRFSQQFGTLPFGYDHKYVYTPHRLQPEGRPTCRPPSAARSWRSWTALSPGARPTSGRLHSTAPAVRGSAASCRAPRPTPTRRGSASSSRCATDAGFTRNELTRFLEANRIETRNLFSGNLLRHPAFLGYRRIASSAI